MSTEVISLREAIGANGMAYDILDLPLTISGWGTAIHASYSYELADSPDALPRIMASRRYFAEFARNRWDIALTVGAFYLLMVFFLPKILFGKNAGNGKSKYSDAVRTPFALWNLFLAVFSTWGVCNTLPHMIVNIQKDWYLCEDIMGRADYPGIADLPGTAMIVFIFSKIPELTDTFFLILKNRPVRLLQWYHHISVMLFCWLALATEYAPAGWFAAMNYFVHSIMYTYFALFTRFTSTRKVLKKLGPFVTLLQTSQMVVGVIVNVIAGTSHLAGDDCYVMRSTVVAALVMYSSYFVLFAKLFYDSVIKTKKAVMSCQKECANPSERKKKE